MTSKHTCITLEEVLACLRMYQGGMSLRAMANAMDITPAYLSDIYNGKRNPGPKVLSFLNLRKVKTVQMYERMK